MLPVSEYFCDQSQLREYDVGLMPGNDWYLIMNNDRNFESFSVSVTVGIRAKRFAKATITKWKGGEKEVCSGIAI